MIVSSKGRYALRVMIDLAENSSEEHIPLKDIAARQEISQKYVEGIMTVLSKGGLIDAAHGRGGGYKLNRAPGEYSLGEILRLTEGSLAPVACLAGDAKPCARTVECRTRPVWDGLNDLINNYLDDISLQDLLK